MRPCPGRAARLRALSGLLADFRYFQSGCLPAALLIFRMAGSEKPGFRRAHFSVLGMGTVYRVKVPNSPAGGKSLAKRKVVGAIR